MLLEAMLPYSVRRRPRASPLFESVIAAAFSRALVAILEPTARR